MKKFLSILSLIPSLLWGTIYESGKMEDVLPHVDEETWVFIDVDNTLIESCLQLGSPQWREYFLRKAMILGFGKEERESQLDKFWLFIQPYIPVRLVDPDAVEVIEKLKKSNPCVFALTAREPIETPHTQKQLSSVGLSLSSTAFPRTMVLPANDPALLDQGVIYCGENTKAETLLAFFIAAGHIPKKVVFVDDKLEQVTALEKMLEERGVEFVGIRFNAADERVNSFDRMIAEVQFSFLPKVISDEEARQFLSIFSESKKDNRIAG